MSANRVLNYNTNIPLQPGYYILSTLFNAGGPTARIGYSSFNYICPFDFEFPDVNFNFQGCTARTNNQPGFPCLNFDYQNQVCLNCYHTHVL